MFFVIELKLGESAAKEVLRAMVDEMPVSGPHALENNRVRIWRVVPETKDMLISVNSGNSLADYRQELIG